MHALEHSVGETVDERAVSHADRVVLAIASRQHAMVHASQLAAAGLGRGAIAHRMACGRLVRMHAGVYLAGPVVPPFGVEMAAVLAGGTGTNLSHQAALAVWGVHGELGGRMHITVAGRQRGRIPGVTVHRTARLDRRDTRRRHGIPLTALARSLLDAAATLEPAALARAVDEARVRRLVRDSQLADVLQRHPRRRGAAGLSEMLETRPALTRSAAEEQLLALVRAAGIPPHGVNARVGRHEVDFLWRSERLIVEIDGYAFHASRNAFERDRRRDAELLALGYRVLRVTWRQLVHEPEAVIARIAQALVRQTPG